MPIIDYKYFGGGLLKIPVRDPDEREEIDRYIAIYEPEYLDKVLGKELAQAFLAGIETDPIEQRWIDLLQGSGNWPGFKDEDKYQSPIANYVYIKFFVEHQDLFLPTGNIKAKNENSIPANSRLRTAMIWNDMVNYNWLLHGFVYSSGAYSEFAPENSSLFANDNIYDV